MPSLAGIQLRNNIWTIQGPPDSGKSNLAKFMLTLDAYESHLVYDPYWGFDPEVHNVLRPPSQEFKWLDYEAGNPELNQGIKRYIIDVDRADRPDYFVIDEAGQLVPNQKPGGQWVGHLSAYNAHMGISVGLITQRWAELNSHLKNKATHHFIMGYKGANDRKALRDLHKDLPEALDQAKQEIGPFAFAYTGPDNTLKIFHPVPETGKKAKR